MNYSLTQCKDGSEIEIAQFDTLARAYNYINTMLFGERDEIIKSLLADGVMYSSNRSDVYYKVLEIPERKSYFIDDLA